MAKTKSKGSILAERNSSQKEEASISEAVNSAEEQIDSITSFKMRKVEINETMTVLHWSVIKGTWIPTWVIEAGIHWLNSTQILIPGANREFANRVCAQLSEFPLKRLTDE